MVETSGERRRGRPPTIEAERIVGAAVELIDQSGIQAGTMRAVADRLAVTPMSLYRHVRDKADLLGLSPDSLLGAVADDVARKRRALTALTAVASAHCVEFPVNE